MELYYETAGPANPDIQSPADGNLPTRSKSEWMDRTGNGGPSVYPLAGSREGLAQLPRMLALAVDAALIFRRLGGPLPAGSTAEVFRAVSDALGPEEVPVLGMGAENALRLMAQVLVEYGIDLSHPRAAAHLQPPPLCVATVADTLASATNASLDTYDSGPSAIAVERWLIGALAKMARLGPRADGVLTPGGSLSNLLGILLARDATGWRLNIDARRAGVAAIPTPVVLCSELAHFSVHRACAVLGLGENAVHPVPTDARRIMRTDALEEILQKLEGKYTPVAIVATAGTTDFGSIDPLAEIADLAAKHRIWLHVDAAYGFGALFSDRLASRLAGIERADSITLDLHKLGWQPAAASVLMVKDGNSFTALEREVAYLNPVDDADAGLDGLLGRSLQTTRRPDAVKIVATLLAHGRNGLGAMVDHCHDLARYAERRISKEMDLDLVSAAGLTTVVFRYRSPKMRAGANVRREDAIQGALRRLLLERGIALIGRTEATIGETDDAPRVCLKFTLLNPVAKTGDVDDLVNAVLRAGRDAEQEVGEGAA